MAKKQKYFPSFLCVFKHKDGTLEVRDDVKNLSLPRDTAVKIATYGITSIATAKLKLEFGR